MRALLTSLTALLFIIFIAAAAQADPGLLYGKVYTVDDEIFEGFIRWDKNEASWDDILDGNKELDDRSYKKRQKSRYKDRSRQVKIFGVTVYSEDGDFFTSWSGDAQSGIMMGNIKTLVPVGDDEAELTLKSGEVVELKGGSGDIGDDNREILIDDKDEGIIELYWDDIDKIEFEPTPNEKCDFGERLYGTLTTRRGEEFTGFVCWDMDETFNTDILDGDERHRKRKIEFSRIKSIERRSSSSAEVTLKSGKTMRLDDSNDIDSGNRGIVISDIKLGRVVVNWDEFGMLEFSDPPPGPKYSDFDGGRRLEGTVITEDGEKYSGEIKWDDDEEYTWEILDGEMYDVDIDIIFGNIKSIEKASRRSSRVTLRDGRTFKLRGSNDVDNDNKGIIVYANGDETYIDWEDFDSVQFSN
jgi:hypothetical protein